MSRRNDSSFDPEFLEGLRQGRRGRDRTGGGGGRRSRGRQKAMQLCRQAQRALSLALEGECDDDVLRSAYVMSVEPAPDATQLLVRLVIPRSAGDVRADEVMTRLARVHGVLRRAVAEAVTRKRAPELTFVVVPEDADRTDGAPRADDASGDGGSGGAGGVA